LVMLTQLRHFMKRRPVKFVTIVDRLVGRGPEIEIDTRGATGRGAYP
jgi:hypothetical protein